MFGVLQVFTQMEHKHPRFSASNSTLVPTWGGVFTGKAAVVPALSLKEVVGLTPLRLHFLYFQFFGRIPWFQENPPQARAGELCR